MTKFISFLLLVVAITSVHASGIEPKSPVGMSVVKAGNTYKLFYQGEKSGAVKVTIYDAKGQALLKDRMNHVENFMRPYNFSALPAGEYTIELVDGQGVRYEKITHSFASLIDLAKLRRLSKDENRYLLTVPNSGKNTLTVKIFDAEDNLKYESREAMNGNFGKVYNLSTVKGAFSFEVTDGNGRSNQLSHR
jgi:hypothetical protein